MNPLAPAVQVAAESRQFSDLEKVLLIVILAALVAGGFVAWRVVAWIAANLKDMVAKLIAELGTLREALTSSESKHAARADEIKAEVRAVGVEVKALDKSVSDLGGRISGAEDVLNQARLELRDALVPAEPATPPDRQPTTKLRAVRG